MSFCIIIHRNSISYAMLESVSTGYLNNVIIFLLRTWDFRNILL